MSCVSVFYKDNFHRIFAASVVEPANQWDQSSMTVTQGDDLTLTCTVDTSTPLDVVRIARNGDRTLPISDNDELKRPFTNTNGRYRIDYNRDFENNVDTVVLHYTGMYSL